MRNLVLFNLMTVDGFFAGPNGEIDWHNVDEEFNQFAIEQLSTAGGLIFGRTTYQMMADYWPTPQAITDDPIVAGMMNELAKIVFSKTLDRADWNNTRLVKGDAVEEARQLKEQPGKDLFIMIIAHPTHAGMKPVSIRATPKAAWARNANTTWATTVAYGHSPLPRKLVSAEKPRDALMR